MIDRMGFQLKVNGVIHIQHPFSPKYVKK